MGESSENFDVDYYSRKPPTSDDSDQLPPPPPRFDVSWLSKGQWLMGEERMRIARMRTLALIVQYTTEN
jgi:hypothetical protein